MMPLFTEASKWIWLDEGKPNTYAEVRLHHTGDTLHISVEGQYVVFADGERINSTQYPDFPAHKVVQLLDVKGAKSILIQCWYQGIDTLVTREEKPGLRFELYEGDTLVEKSDAETLIRPIAGYVSGEIPHITPQLGFGYICKAEKEAEWRQAVVIDKVCYLAEKKIKELELLAPVEGILKIQGTYQLGEGETTAEKMQSSGLFWKDIRAFKPGDTFVSDENDGIFLIYDFGQMYEGYVGFDIDCKESCAIDIGFGEHLEDGRVRTTVGHRNLAVTAHNGKFVHWFRRLGCRYVELFIHSHAAKVNSVTTIPVYYPEDDEAFVAPQDHLHRKIAEVSRRTLRSCMHEHYEDCPWREQALYGFDSRNQMLCGYYAFGEYDYARENMRLLSWSLREDGLLELCSPARHRRTIPSFSLAFIIELEEYCRHSGDVNFAEEMLPTVETIISAFKPYIRDGLIYTPDKPTYWNFYEWQDMLSGDANFGKPVPEAGLQFFYILALQRVQKLYVYIGKGGNVWVNETLKAMTEGAEAYWDNENKAYASYIVDGMHIQYAELIQSLALYAGIVTEERQARLRERLYNNEFVTVTLSYSLFKYEALLQDPAYAEKVFDEIAERWGRMLYANATTFWEVDEGAEAFDRAGSLCHGWSAIPYYLYGAYGAGIKATGCGKWEKTAPAGNINAKYRIRTGNGFIEG